MRLDKSKLIPSNKFEAKKSYKFHELFPWINDLSEQNVNSLQIETGYYGVHPRYKPVIEISEFEQDIVYNLNILKNETLIPVKLKGIVGGGYKNVIFFLKDGGERELFIEYDHVVWNDEESYQYFKFSQSARPKISSSTKEEK